MEMITKCINGITPLDSAAQTAAKDYLDSLAKPPGSLGMLEDLALQLAGIRGEIVTSLSRRAVIIMSSDNGIVEEGVASAPQSVTLSQTINFTRGLTGVAVLAKQFNTDLLVVDVGINADVNYPGIINRKIRKSTYNIAKEPAMSYREAQQAIQIGIETALEAVKNGYQILGVGEMGIGNTSTSAAVLCALTGISPDKTVGKGGGLSDEGYIKKLAIVKNCLIQHQPNAEDPVDVLAKVGGFDLAAMTGVFLGAAYTRTPVVIDGFISIVAALAAARLNPLAKDYMIASHISYEPGYLHTANELGLTPSLQLGMRLGEGSGCPIMFSIIDASCAVVRDMATFAEAEINDDYVDAIRNEDAFRVNKRIGD